MMNPDSMNYSINTNLLGNSSKVDTSLTNPILTVEKSEESNISQTKPITDINAATTSYEIPISSLSAAQPIDQHYVFLDEQTSFLKKENVDFSNPGNNLSIKTSSPIFDWFANCILHSKSQQVYQRMFNPNNPNFRGFTLSEITNYFELNIAFFFLLLSTIFQTLLIFIVVVLTVAGFYVHDKYILLFVLLPSCTYFASFKLYNVSLQIASIVFTVGFIGVVIYEIVCDINCLSLLSLIIFSLFSIATQIPLCYIMMYIPQDHLKRFGPYLKRITENRTPSNTTTQV